MISHYEPIAVVIMRDGVVKTICCLGNVNLESDEYDRLANLVEAKGYSIYLTTVAETNTFASLYNKVQQAIEHDSPMIKKKFSKIRPHPNLKALFDRRDAVEKQLGDINTEIKKATIDLAKTHEDKMSPTSFVVNMDCLFLGYDECPGPLGICVYDNENDEYHDACLFCGEPEERK